MLQNDLGTLVLYQDVVIQRHVKHIWGRYDRIAWDEFPATFVYRRNEMVLIDVHRSEINSN